MANVTRSFFPTRLARRRQLTVARLFGDYGENSKPKLSVVEEPSVMPATAAMVVMTSMMPPVTAIRQVIGVGETTV